MLQTAMNLINFQNDLKQTIAFFVKDVRHTVVWDILKIVVVFEMTSLGKLTSNIEPRQFAKKGSIYSCDLHGIYTVDHAFLSKKQSKTIGHRLLSSHYLLGDFCNSDESVKLANRETLVMPFFSIISHCLQLILFIMYSA